MFKSLLQLIKQRLDSQLACFRQFLWGLALFIFGITVIYATNAFHEGPASLRMELITLSAGIVLVTGFLLAITAQIFMIIYRFRHVRDHAEDENKPSK